MHTNHPGVNSRQQLSTEQTSSKPAVTFALPMYTVGIGVFFLYTCFKVCWKNLILFIKSYIFIKYWTKRNDQENKIKLRYSSNNIQWNSDKRKFKYHLNNRHSEDDGENEEDSYAGIFIIR